MTKRRFGNCIVKVWKISGPGRLYPWRFSVKKDRGKEYKFVGIPNYCETQHSALMRGWWRAKWINEGTYNKRYV